MEFIIGAIALGSYCAGYLSHAQDQLDKEAAPKPAKRPGRRRQIKAGPVVVALPTTPRPQAVDPMRQQWSLESQFKSIKRGN